MSQIVEQGREEWLSLIEPLLEEASTEAADSSSEFEPFPAATPTKYKTEKCRYWTLGLECPFREQCCFAHGSNELRNKQHLPRNYRTKVCANFQRTGCCKYGERCQFLHPAAKPIALRRPSSISVSYADVLERMVEQPISSPAIPVRRLKVFEEFQLDSFDCVDWKFKKNRLYSI